MRFLDHLRSIRGRNLVLSDANLDSTTYTFDLLVNQEPAATQQGQQKLYASEQVPTSLLLPLAILLSQFS